jgi:hypothetical protein
VALIQIKIILKYLRKQQEIHNSSFIQQTIPLPDWDETLANRFKVFYQSKIYDNQNEAYNMNILQESGLCKRR